VILLLSFVAVFLSFLLLVLRSTVLGRYQDSR
jgi:hypothetical protein